MDRKRSMLHMSTVPTGVAPISAQAIDEAIYRQFEAETDRYLRNHTLVDVDRYGIGSGIMKTIIGLMAMHAMSGLMGSGESEAPASQTAKAPEGPSNQDFEKLHPRARTADGKHKPGQFAPKNTGGSAPKQPDHKQAHVRPLTDGNQVTTSPDTSGQPGAPQQQPLQTPRSPMAAKVAEKWGLSPEERLSETMEMPSIRNYPDNLGKPPEQQVDYAPAPHALESFTQQVMQNLSASWSSGESPVVTPPQPASNADIFANPAAEARKKKAELDRITKFDPTEFVEPEQPDAPPAPLTVADTGGDYAALDKARKERTNKVKSFRQWEKQTQENPEANTAEIAAEYELDVEPFQKYIQDVQAFEEGEWKRREAVKTAIRKAWGVNSSDLSAMENRKGQDHSSLQGSDGLKGNLTDDQMYEFLGSDEGAWAQNAWDMLREDPPPRPGAHDKDWLRSHAERFAAAPPEQSHEEFPEPPDGFPFSMRSITLTADRYFREARESLRTRRQVRDSAFWTSLDSWL